MSEQYKENLSRNGSLIDKSIDYRKIEPLPRSSAIRRYCVDICCAKSAKEVKECHLYDCPLWPYRTGRNTSPFAKKRVMSEEHKEKLKKALTEYRMAKQNDVGYKSYIENTENGRENADD